MVEDNVQRWEAMQCYISSSTPSKDVTCLARTYHMLAVNARSYIALKLVHRMINWCACTDNCLSPEGHHSEPRPRTCHTLLVAVGLDLSLYLLNRPLFVIQSRKHMFILIAINYF